MTVELVIAKSLYCIGAVGLFVFINEAWKDSNYNARSFGFWFAAVLALCWPIVAIGYCIKAMIRTLSTK